MIPYEYGLQKEAGGRLAAILSKAKPYLNPKNYIKPAAILGLTGAAGIGSLAYLGAGSNRNKGPALPSWLTKTYNTGQTYGQPKPAQGKGITKTIPTETKIMDITPAKQETLAGPMASEFA